MGINRVKKRGKERIEVRKRWPDGTTFRRYYPNMTLAKHALMRIDAAILDGSWQERKQDDEGTMPTIADFSRRFLEEYAKPRLRSWDRYELSLRTVAKDLGQIPVDQLKREKLYRWMKKRKNQVTVASVNRDIAALKRMYSWAYEIGVLPDNPLRGFRLFREEIKERRPLTLDEYGLLLRIAHDPLLRTFLTILGETGCRRSEALHLKRSDLDLVNRTVTFNRVKNSKARVVPMSPRLDVALQEYLTSSTTRSPYVLINPQTGKRLVDPRKGFEGAAKCAEVPWLRLHDLRRFRATQWAMAGVPPHTIQKLLGHASLQTTMRYLQHVDTSFDLVREAFERESGRQMGDTPGGPQEALPLSH